MGSSGHQVTQGRAVATGTAGTAMAVPPFIYFLLFFYLYNDTPHLSQFELASFY